MLIKLCLAAESMALEASARVAVTHAIENKDDLGRMLGTHLLCTTRFNKASFAESLPFTEVCSESLPA